MEAGLEAITTMMTGFFEKFPEVNWQVASYEMSKQYENCVEFDFVRSSLDPSPCIHNSQDDLTTS